MTKKVHNFNAGPAAIPREVIEKAQTEFADFHGIGYSIMEESHRSKVFEEVINTAEKNIRELMKISDDYAVLFLQGGASLQFAMVPMNLMLPGRPALYANTGSWAKKALSEAKLFGETKVIFDGSANKYTSIDDPEEWVIDRDAAYAYICSNNTIAGTQFHQFPETGDVPLIADMSSDIMSREVDVNRFGLIFAGAQKNLGPSGVTLVIIRKDLLSRTPEKLTTMLKYTTHAENNSLYNTPPTFAIYMLKLVTDWVKDKGGLDEIERINSSKSLSLYECIDNSSFYRGVADGASRSRMNICFRLPSEELEKKFISEATAAGLIGLKGHRSVGGLRASIYNAMTLEGVSTLIDFMGEFEKTNG